MINTDAINSIITCGVAIEESKLFWIPIAFFKYGIRRKSNPNAIKNEKTVCKKVSLKNCLIRFILPVPKTFFIAISLFLVDDFAITRLIKLRQDITNNKPSYNVIAIKSFKFSLPEIRELR